MSGGPASRADILAACAALGRAPPAFDVPTLDPALEFVWQRWQVMHAGRARAGLSGAALPLDEDRITAWAARVGVDADDVLVLFRAMDAELIAHESAAA